MNTLSPLISVLLFQAPPSELEPAVVAIIALSIGIDAPDHGRRLLHQGPVLVSGKLLRDPSAEPEGELHCTNTTPLIITGHRTSISIISYYVTDSQRFLIATSGYSGRKPDSTSTRGKGVIL
jgi:hypothetical protein